MQHAEPYGSAHAGMLKVRCRYRTDAGLLTRGMVSG
jgi:hypothetical protein